MDTKKDKARLEAAYDDPLGVTAAFNRNVLNHVNRVLGCDFVTEAFVHRGFYNAGAGRIEMHLEATSPQAVVLDGTRRTFAAGERIHTENSYKYAPRGFAALLNRAGFRAVRCWQDAHGDFAVFYAAERAEAARVAREAHAGELPSRFGRKEIAVACANDASAAWRTSRRAARTGCT